jgi:hypothetical protein
MNGGPSQFSHSWQEGKKKNLCALGSKVQPVMHMKQTNKKGKKGSQYSTGVLMSPLTLTTDHEIKGL